MSLLNKTWRTEKKREREVNRHSVPTVSEIHTEKNKTNLNQLPYIEMPDFEMGSSDNNGRVCVCMRRVFAYIECTRPKEKLFGLLGGRQLLLTSSFDSDSIICFCCHCCVAIKSGNCWRTVVEPLIEKNKPKINRKVRFVPFNRVQLHEYQSFM